MDFATLTCTITNKLDRPIRPAINISPHPSAAGDSSWAGAATTAAGTRQSLLPAGGRNVVFDGSLTGILPLLQPHEKAQHEVGVSFLAAGQYAFRAAVEEVDIFALETVDPPVSKVRFSDVLHVNVSA